MTKKERIFILTLPSLIVIASIVFLAQLSYSNPIVNSENQIDRYWTALTGNQQIPPVKTDALGFVGEIDDLSRFVFTVNAENIGNVTGIYIYKGKENQNGTVVLDLMKAERDLKMDKRIINVTSEGKMTGTLPTGGITKKELQGELKDKSVSDFYNLMTNGPIYVSILTKDFPKGEIRGNSFVEIDDLFPTDIGIQWKTKAK